VSGPCPIWQPATEVLRPQAPSSTKRAHSLSTSLPGAVESKTKFVFARMVQVLNNKEQLVARNIQALLSFDEYARNAKKIQDHGWNYFICINQTKGARRRAEDIEKVRAHFLDFDEEPQELPTLCPPTSSYKASAASHWYWHTGPHRYDCDLAAAYSADSSVSSAATPQCGDLPRVMRLPGAYHLKDLRAPFLV